MKRLISAIFIIMLCMSTALADDQVFTGEKYQESLTGYSLTVFWNEGNQPERALLEDIQKVYFESYCAMRETFGTTDVTDVRIFLVDESSMSGNSVAYTTNTDIYCSRQFLEQSQGNLNCIVHELFHVVQNGYPGAADDELISALCEGLADAARYEYGVFEDTNWSLPAYDESQSYMDSYTVTASFLNWTAEAYDKTLCIRLNRVLHEDSYSDGFWQKVTGYTLDELWELYSQAE